MKCKLQRYLGVILVAVGLFSSSATASILITFDDSAEGVITTTFSGSFNLIGLAYDKEYSAVAYGASPTELYTVVGPYDSYTGGTGTGFFINTSPSQGLNTAFGLDTGGEITVPTDTPLNGVFDSILITQTYQWNAENLSDIGLGSLSTTPITVWSNPHAPEGEGDVLFVAIPEPASVSLLGFVSVLGFLIRRHFVA